MSLPMMETEEVGVDPVFMVEDGSADETTTISKAPTAGDPYEDIDKTVMNETRNANLSRTLFLSVLAMASIVVVATAFALTNNQDRLEFETSFEYAAEKVSLQAQSQLAAVFESTNGLARSVTLSGSSSQETWPYHTLINFEVLASQWRELGKESLLAYLPLLAPSQLSSWGSYSVENQGWINASLEIQGMQPIASSIAPEAYDVDSEGDQYATHERIVSSIEDNIAPVWQFTPPPMDPTLVNFDTLSDPAIQAAFEQMLDDRRPILANITSMMHVLPNASEPYAVVISPIQRDPKSNQSIVAVSMSLLPWSQFMMTSSEIEGMLAVLSNSCDDNLLVTYHVTNATVDILGFGDLHEPVTYDHYLQQIILNPNDSCVFTFSLYPDAAMEKAFQTNAPVVAALLLSLLFVFIVAVFFTHEFVERKKLRKLRHDAARAHGILNTLFPENVRQRMIAEQEERMKSRHAGTNHEQWKKLLHDDEFEVEDDEEDDNLFAGKPIADLFTSTTILFGDVVGFTSWSSVREPAQVFTLLETLYKNFDQIADRYHVFKVETIGDCYVAVTGLPIPRDDHAVLMCRFANEVLYKMQDLVQLLEVELGPGTSALNMRFGIHSGPVTAGVLRGKRSRFQLFGDTMNTAARHETTCTPGRIQVSESTYELLVAAGKTHWLRAREEKVAAKGKGELQTYWLEIGRGGGKSLTSASAHSSMTVESSSSDFDGTVSHSASRHISWTVQLLRKLLKDIAGRREALPRQGDAINGGALQFVREPNTTVLQEVKEVIILPEFDASAAKRQKDPRSVRLGEDVEAQLRDFVTTIAFMYRENPFHNFRHVAHVCMSVSKLLSRIVAPIPTHEVVAESQPRSKGKSKGGESDIQDFISTIQHDAVGAYLEDHKKAVSRTKRLHDHTYGITSDPLTQFACVFSALIHDVQHSGVPNSQLAKENPSIAAAYANKSIAEQVSVDLAWNLLMDDRFAALRGAIYSTEAEMSRFRQLVVNSVMATDIVDKDLKALRDTRWAKVFSGDRKDKSRENINRKATIVIEHIIQASDVSHTMQHWHVYRYWNECLFREMYKAWKEGRGSNPAEFWYEGEIGFFDHYIIPLTRKLKDCGVFGVSSDEYLNYAVANRKEWAACGKEVVEEYIANAEKEIEDRRRKTSQHILSQLMEEEDDAEDDDDDEFACDRGEAWLDELKRSEHMPGDRDQMFFY